MRGTLVTFVLLAQAVIAYSQGLRTVEPEKLHGQTLFSREENFSIDAPDGWSWSTIDSPRGHTYLCKEGADGPTFIVTTALDGALWMTRATARNLVAGMTDTIRESGARNVQIDYSGSTRLFPDSYQLQGTMTDRKGRAHRILGYMGTRRHIYVVQAVFDPDAAADRKFEAFVDTFRLLTPVSDLPTLSLAFTAVDLVLIVVALWLAFFICRWPPQYRRVEWLLLIFGLLGLLYVGAGWYATWHGTKTPDQLDEILGQVAGFAFVTLITCGIVAAKRHPSSRS